jgi:hypothetical protein
LVGARAKWRKVIMAKGKKATIDVARSIDSNGHNRLTEPNPMAQLTRSLPIVRWRLYSRRDRPTMPVKFRWTGQNRSNG